MEGRLHGSSCRVAFREWVAPLISIQPYRCGRSTEARPLVQTKTQICFDARSFLLASCLEQAVISQRFDLGDIGHAPVPDQAVRCCSQLTRRTIQPVFCGYRLGSVLLACHTFLYPQRNFSDS